MHDLTNNAIRLQRLKEKYKPIELLQEFYSLQEWKREYVSDYDSDYESDYESGGDRDSSMTERPERFEKAIEMGYEIYITAHVGNVLGRIDDNYGYIEYIQKTVKAGHLDIYQALHPSLDHHYPMSDLFHAVESGNLELVKYICSHKVPEAFSGYKHNGFINAFHTPNNYDIINYLAKDLEIFTKPVDTNTRWRLFDVVLFYFNYDYVVYLFDKGLNLPDAGLHFVVKYSPRSREQFEAFCRIFDYLLDKKGYRLSDYPNILMEVSNTDVIRYLISRGASAKGATRRALLVAVQAADCHLVEFLLAAGADVHYNSDCAISMALCDRQHPETIVLCLVNILIKHGADYKRYPCPNAYPSVRKYITSLQ